MEKEWQIFWSTKVFRAVLSVKGFSRPTQSFDSICLGSMKECVEPVSIRNFKWGLKGRFISMKGVRTRGLLDLCTLMGYGGCLLKICVGCVILYIIEATRLSPKRVCCTGLIGFPRVGLLIVVIIWVWCITIVISSSVVTSVSGVLIITSIFSERFVGSAIVSSV